MSGPLLRYQVTSFQHFPVHFTLTNPPIRASALQNYACVFHHDNLRYKVCRCIDLQIGAIFATLSTETDHSCNLWTLLIDGRSLIHFQGKGGVAVD